MIIRSFKLFHWIKPTTTQMRSRHSTDTVSEFHAEAPQATVNEGLAQGLYAQVRGRFEPATLRTKGIDSTNEPPCSMISRTSTLLFKCKYIYSKVPQATANEGLAQGP